MEALKAGDEAPRKKRSIELFPLKVWLSTIFFGPLLFAIASAIIDPPEFWLCVYFAVLLFLIGIILTLPFLSVYWYIYVLMLERRVKARRMKLFLCLIATGMILLTFELFWAIERMDQKTAVLLGLYVVANIGMTCVLRLPAMTEFNHEKRKQTEGEVHF